ncbi:uncharacterized protein LOC135824713 [Sycon ciliatum]|uniref:uncharacterized protein LOC135824713 n=1 Tax=Sycon ciliatum TaxID=27933 RepID=UPI0031F652C3
MHITTTSCSCSPAPDRPDSAASLADSCMDCGRAVPTAAQPSSHSTHWITAASRQSPMPDSCSRHGNRFRQTTDQPRSTHTAAQSTSTDRQSRRQRGGACIGYSFAGGRRHGLGNRTLLLLALMFIFWIEGSSAIHCSCDTCGKRTYCRYPTSSSCVVQVGPVGAGSASGTGELVTWNARKCVSADRVRDVCALAAPSTWRDADGVRYSLTESSVIFCCSVASFCADAIVDRIEALRGNVSAVPENSFLSVLKDLDRAIQERLDNTQPTLPSSNNSGSGVGAGHLGLLAALSTLCTIVGVTIVMTIFCVWWRRRLQRQRGKMVVTSSSRSTASPSSSPPPSRRQHSHSSAGTGSTPMDITTSSSSQSNMRSPSSPTSPEHHRNNSGDGDSPYHRIPTTPTSCDMSCTQGECRHHHSRSLSDCSTTSTNQHHHRRSLTSSSSHSTTSSGGHSNNSGGHSNQSSTHSMTSVMASSPPRTMPVHPNTPQLQASHVMPAPMSSSPTIATTGEITSSMTPSTSDQRHYQNTRYSQLNHHHHQQPYSVSMTSAVPTTTNSGISTSAPYKGMTSSSSSTSTGMPALHRDFPPAYDDIDKPKKSLRIDPPPQYSACFGTTSARHQSCQPPSSRRSSSPSEQQRRRQQPQPQQQQQLWTNSYYITEVPPNRHVCDTPDCGTPLPWDCPGNGLGGNSGSAASHQHHHRMAAAVMQTPPPNRTISNKI